MSQKQSPLYTTTYLPRAEETQVGINFSKKSDLHFVCWKKSIAAKVKYEKVLREEAKKMQKNPNYKPRIKIAKKYLKVLQSYVENEERVSKLKSKKNKYSKGRK